MSDIKMSEVFDLPVYQSKSSKKIIKDARYDALARYDWEKEAEAAVHAINSHDKLTQQVKDLEFSLDNRDCYIADADMKNEDLTQQVAELRAALLSIKSHQQTVTPSGFEFSSTWQIADKALSE